MCNYFSQYLYKMILSLISLKLIMHHKKENHEAILAS